MTIDAHIPKAIQSEWPTRKGRRKGFPALEGGCVVCVDATYFLHVAALGEESIQGITGLEYIHVIFNPFLKMLRVFDVRCLIFVLDMATHVPAEKKETQDKRRKQSKAIPYPPGSTLRFDGVHLPNDQVVPVIPTNLLATPGMRVQVMALFETLT